METYKAPKLKIKKKKKSMVSPVAPHLDVSSTPKESKKPMMAPVAPHLDVSADKPKKKKGKIIYRKSKKASDENIMDRRGYNEALGEELLQKGRLKNELRIRKKLKGIK